MSIKWGFSGLLHFTVLNPISKLKSHFVDELLRQITFEWRCKYRFGVQLYFKKMLRIWFWHGPRITKNATFGSIWRRCHHSIRWQNMPLSKKVHSDIYLWKQVNSRSSTKFYCFTFIVHRNKAAILSTASHPLQHSLNLRIYICWKLISSVLSHKMPTSSIPYFSVPLFACTNFACAFFSLFYYVLPRTKETPYIRTVDKHIYMP